MVEIFRRTIAIITRDSADRIRRYMLQAREEADNQFVSVAFSRVKKGNVDCVDTVSVGIETVLVVPFVFGLKPQVFNGGVVHRLLMIRYVNQRRSFCTRREIPGRISVQNNIRHI